MTVSPSVPRVRGGVPVRPESPTAREAASRDAPLPGMVGTDPAMRAVYRLVRSIAPTDDRVAIVGETGTGKELVAAALHALSARCGRRMVSVNAAAIPETLFEGEVFGVERGAHTDARESRPGYLELANDSTLHLDEAGSASWLMQAKLLRVMENGESQRVGGRQLRAVNVRWVASTQGWDTSGTVGAGLRPDLWYRFDGESWRLRLESPPGGRARLSPAFS